MDLLVTLQDGGCATYNKGGYAFLKGNGNGKFSAGPENCTGGSSPTYPVVADLNGDGELDAFFGFSQENSTYLANGPVVLQGKGDGGDFSAKSTCRTSRKAGWDCAITVTFTPSTTGTGRATLSIKDAIGTQTVSLTGTGK